MRLRPEVWQRGAECAPRLTCDQVDTGDADRIFSYCVLPSTAGPPSAAAQRLCEAIEAFHGRIGRRCRNLPAGAECQLAAPLFTDEALNAASGTCFGPMVTCDQALDCFADRLGIPPGRIMTMGP
jgi:hypothetical protein